jgi:hypothetical protein
VVERYQIITKKVIFTICHDWYLIVRVEKRDMDLFFFVGSASVLEDAGLFTIELFEEGETQFFPS